MKSVCNRFFRWITSAVILAVIAGVGVLSGGMAAAASPTGTLTLFPSTGSDLTVISGRTNGTCNVPGTPDAPVDGYNAVVTGPGEFAPNPDEGRPDGYSVRGTSDIGFSTTDPIDFSLRSTFRDFAVELGTLLQPGDYVITFRCVNQFLGTVYQTFSATLTFSGGPPATTYVVTNPPLGTPTLTPTPLPPTPRPSPTPTPRPTPTPPTGTLTLFPSTGSDRTVISGRTNGTCNVPGTPDAPVDGYNVVVTGPGGFAPNPDEGRPDGHSVVGTSDLGFSTTDPIDFVSRADFRQFAAELGTLLQPGDYVITLRCVNQFRYWHAYQTFSATLTFSGGPPATTYVVTNPPLGTPTPTPTPLLPTPTPTPSPTPTAGITPTTATLKVTPNHGYTFIPKILIARVSPSNAAGIVKFFDGSTPLGAPVPVTAGFAFLITTLPSGAHSLTAVFTPTDRAYAPSTSSSVSLIVNPLVRSR